MLNPTTMVPSISKVGTLPRGFIFVSLASVLRSTDTSYSVYFKPFSAKNLLASVQYGQVGVEYRMIFGWEGALADAARDPGFPATVTGSNLLGVRDTVVP